MDNKLNAKNLINVGIFTAIYFALFFALVNSGKGVLCHDHHDCRRCCSLKNSGKGIGVPDRSFDGFCGKKRRRTVSRRVYPGAWKPCKTY